MKTFYRFLSLVFCVTLLCGLCSCTKEEVVVEEPALNEEEINSKYDDILNSAAEDAPIDSGASVIGEKFSPMDFTITNSDGTVSYNLDLNSFAKFTMGGTFFNYIAPGNEVETHEPGYKTARGLTLNNTAAEYFEKYGLDDSNTVYLNSEDMTYYAPVGGVFSGRLTALFATSDGMNYDSLPGGDVQKFLYERDASADGSYIDPSKITNLFPQYTTIAALEIAADNVGTVYEVTIYRFDKV